MPLHSISKWLRFIFPELVMVELPFEKMVSMLFIEIAALPEPFTINEFPITAVVTVTPEVFVNELDDPEAIVIFTFPLITIFLKLARGTRDGFLQE